MGYWDRLLKYMQGGPAAIDGWPAPIPIEEFNRALARTLGSALATHGFEAATPRRWVRSTRAPMRDILELQALRGDSYAPMWGLSLDFVPHLTSSGDVKWHRTAKSARFDLVYRPIDYARSNAESRAWNASTSATPAELEDDLARVTGLVLAEAIPFWDGVRGVDDLPRVYREHRERPSVGLPYASYPQQVLAAAFVSATSDRARGLRELGEFCRAYEVAPDTARKLEALVDQADGTRWASRHSAK